MKTPNAENPENKNSSRENEFHDLSLLAQFHKAPKIFGEKAEYPFIDAITDQMRGALAKAQERGSQHTPETQLSTYEGKILKQVIQSAMTVQFSSDADGDPVEQRKLELCKNKIREIFGEVLKGIKEYIASILSLSKVRRTGTAADSQDADLKRKLKHDKLMKDISILNRSLLWWFGEFDPENLPENEREMYEKQRKRYICEKIERVSIPISGIYPASMNQKDRHQITRWAQSVYSDMVTVESLDSLIKLDQN